MTRIGLSVVLVALVACSSGETVASTTSTSTTSTTAPATTTTQFTTTTAAPTTTSTLPTTTITAATTTTALPEFPQTAVNVTHGGDSWAVYLSVADNYNFTAPELEEAQDLAESYGILSGTGDLACDQGGAEALGLDPNGEWAAVSVYFDSEADAEQFVDAFEARGHTVEGMGLVQTYCLD